MNTPAQPVNRNPWLRRGLMLAGIAVVAAGAGWAYFTGGRYVSTDNAYVKADKIMLAPDVSGPVISVSVTDNQAVKKGDELFRIEPEPYVAVLHKAEADLATAVLNINKMKTLYRQKQAELERAQVDTDFAGRELKRQSTLIAHGSVSASQRDDAELRHSMAQKKVLILQHELSEILVSLNNDPNLAVEQHPLYKAADAEREKAQISLTRTVVYAPSNGYVGTAPAVGDYARASLPMVNFVSQGPLWIEANFKETDLTDVRPGQAVSIHVDTYPGQIWNGVVESISPATGSEFSVLPAQNSTGNWVKVVQRIPTRIRVENGPQDLPLRTGMSTEVEIDTGRYPHMKQALFTQRDS